jgi:NitT/TauT family transport system permease protein
VIPVALAVGALLLTWQLYASRPDANQQILPTPVAVWNALVAQREPLWRHTLVTLYETVVGFAAALVAGVIFAAVIDFSPWLRRAIYPLLVVSQTIPIITLAPLLVLWFGNGLLSKLIVCALIVFFPVAIATMVGIRSVDARLLELGRSLRATRRQILTTLEIPAALPNIFGGLRVGVTLAVVGAVVGEWAGASKGLAVLINLARGSLFDIPLMFATLLTIALVGLALYLVVVLVERQLVGAR